MSDMGAISTSLHLASELLRPYMATLKDARSRGGFTERQDEVQSLLDVLVPFSLHLRDMSCFNLGIDGERMSEFLRSRHREDWPATRDDIVSLASRLEKSGGPKVALSGKDMSILDDVAWSLDRVCSYLYRKMRRRHHRITVARDPRSSRQGSILVSEIPCGPGHANPGTPPRARPC